MGITPSDTSLLVEQVQIDVLRPMPAWRKLRLIAALNALLSRLAMGGLRGRHPGASDDELWRRLDEQRLGQEVARQFARARAARQVRPAEDQYVSADPLSIILAVVAALDRLGVRYYIGGSLASAIHGTYRATADVDIVAELLEEQADELARLLGQRFYADADMMRDAVQHRSSFNVLDLQTGFKVDVFIPQRRAFDRSQFERRVLTPLGATSEESAYVASAEDTVLAKLDWYRQGGEVSDRQWSDVLGILKVRAQDVDRAYLRRWAAQLGLADLLERAFDDSGLI